MRRVVVLGPGPLRPGIPPGASVLAAELAGTLAASGLGVTVLDASPASALLWPGDDGKAPARRQLQPPGARVLARVMRAEGAEAACVAAAGPVALRALAGEGAGSWFGPSPAELLESALESALETALEEALGAAPVAAPVAAAEEGAGRGVLDVVLASDGEGVELLAAFEASAPGVALADTTHAFRRKSQPGAPLEAALGAPRFVGLATARLALGGKGKPPRLLGVDRADLTLWDLAARVRGLRAGVLLARLLLGEELASARSGASGPRGSLASVAFLERRPSFDFEPYPGADRTLGPKPKSLGATLAVDGAAPPSPTSGRRRVVVVGPGAARAGHGAEASAAARVACREASRLGHEVILVTAREGTGAEAHADSVLVDPGALPLEGPADLLLGFGADPERLPALAGLATDLPKAFFDRARELEAPLADPRTGSLHVVVLTDGERARLVGTFEHVERAAVHAEDAAAVFPALSVAELLRADAEERALSLAVSSGARGLVTARFAVSSAPGEKASLLLEGLSGGATMHALSLGLVLGADVVAEALRVALGARVDGAPAPPLPRHVAVEEHVFPFAALGASDTRLERRPRSTGAVLALGETVSRAYARALAAMGVSLRRPGAEAGQAILLAGAEAEAVELADVGRRLWSCGFELVATPSSAPWMARLRVPHRTTADPKALLSAGDVVAAVVPGTDEAAAELRRTALVAGVVCFTTVDLARVAVHALELDPEGLDDPRALEDWADRSAPSRP